MRDNLEEKFRDRLADYKAEPEEDFLAKIQARVQIKKYFFYQKFIFRASILGICIVLLGLIWWKVVENSTDNLIVSKNEISQLFDNQLITKNESNLNPVSDSLNNATEFEYQKRHLKGKIQDNLNFEGVNPTHSFVNSDSINTNKDNSQLFDNQIINNYSLDSLPQNISLNNNDFIEKKDSTIDEFSPKNTIQDTNLLAQNLKVEQMKKSDSSKNTSNSTIPPKTELKTSKGRFYASLMPLMSYYHIRPNRNDAVLVENIEVGNAFSFQRFGLKIQAGGIIPLQKRLSIRSTLAISQLQQNWSYTITGNQTDSQNQFIRHQQKIWYAGLQGDVLYKLKPLKAFNQHLIAGLNLNFPISERDKSTNLMIQLGYGWTYATKQNFILYFEPNLQISLNRYQDPNKYVKIRPFYGGFNIGILFQ